MLHCLTTSLSLTLKSQNTQQHLHKKEQKVFTVEVIEVVGVDKDIQLKVSAILMVGDDSIIDDEGG